MSSNDQQSGSNPVPADHAGGAANAAAVDLQSIARRRAIVKGLSKGAALAGAAVPLQTLAVGGQRMKLRKATGGPFYQCSVSGNTSVMVSQNPDGLTQCGAQTPSHYKPLAGAGNVTHDNWPTWPSLSVNSVDSAVCYGLNGAAYLPTAAFSSVFGWTDSAGKTIGQYVKNRPNDDETQWITAALNATQFSATFPYTVAEVVAMSQPTYANRVNALAFFKVWLNRTAL